MTNYNERRDKILRSLAYQAYLNAHAPGYTKLDGRTYKTAVDEAKQAFTSLIKELVAEAKPRKKHVGDEVAENRSYTGERLFNAAIDEYHTNILKALEEK